MELWVVADPELELWLAPPSAEEEEDMELWSAPPLAHDPGAGMDT